MRFGAVLFVLMVLTVVAGCASTSPAIKSEPPAEKTDSLSTDVAAFNAGWQAAYRHLQQKAHVTTYALSKCPDEHSWLPKNKPSIPRIQYLRALRHEQKLHNRCADRHDQLAEQYKRLLGRIRAIR